MSRHVSVHREAILAAYFDRLGYYEPAATISRFAASALAQTAFPEVSTAITHLREALGDGAYASLARAGQNMTNAAMATYAFDQIDRAAPTSCTRMNRDDRRCAAGRAVGVIT